MRHTEPTRTPEPATPRPAVRAFSTRELLLTTWDQRRQLAPADQVHFDYERWLLQMSAHNAGVSVDALACMAFENKKQGKPESADDKLLQLVAPRPPRGPGLH